MGLVRQIVIQPANIGRSLADPARNAHLPAGRQVLVVDGPSLSFALPPTTGRSQFQLGGLYMELCKCTKDLCGGRRTGRARPRYSGYIDVAAGHRRCSGNDAMIVVALHAHYSVAFSTASGSDQTSGDPRLSLMRCGHSLTVAVLL